LGKGRAVDLSNLDFSKRLRMTCSLRTGFSPQLSLISGLNIYALCVSEVSSLAALQPGPLGSSAAVACVKMIFSAYLSMLYGFV